MTNERRQPKRGLRAAVSPLELRLYLVALLGVVYTISWRAIGGQAPATESQGATTATSEPKRMVWIDNLPPDMRPTIALPAGWQRETDPHASAAVPPARVVRVPARRAPRVRTRSS